MSIKGRNSVANLRKMMIFNPNVDLVNDNVYTKFGLNKSICSQDIEQKLNHDGINFASSYAFHSWDVNTFFGFVKDYIKTPTAEDLQWQQNMRDEIVSFVRNGYPKTNTWLPYPDKTANLSVKTNPLSAYNPVKCQFWLQNGFFSYAWIN